MKQQSLNETDIVSLIKKVQEQLTLLDRKVDALMGKGLTLPREARPAQTSRLSSQTPVLASDPVPSISRPQEPHQGQTRQMYQAVCADCKKECEIPFKPSGERPVYCKECFRIRKAAPKQKAPLDNKAQAAPVQPVAPVAVVAPQSIAPEKKKKPVAKKPVAKKKPAVAKKPVNRKKK